MGTYLCLPSLPRHEVINVQRQTEHVTSSGIDYLPGDASEPEDSFPPEWTPEGVSIGSSRADERHDQPLGE